MNIFERIFGGMIVLFIAIVMDMLVYYSIPTIITGIGLPGEIQAILYFAVFLIMAYMTIAWPLIIVTSK